MMPTIALPRMPGQELWSSEGRTLNGLVDTILQRSHVVAQQVLHEYVSVEESLDMMEFDDVFPMPPKRRYDVELEITSVRRAAPRFVDDAEGEEDITL
ncbi:MAG: hypothetical protein H0X37_20625 [Herpetosiphonaceae bacterium]|nr:hypothetical protein [Herpetosiphonaceae bacterium]